MKNSEWEKEGKLKTRIKNLMVIILIGSFMIYSILSGIERLIWANVKNYPAFLINDTIQLDSIEKVYELIDITCEPLAKLQKH